MLLQKHAVGIAVDKEMAPKFNGLIYNYIFMMTSEFTNKTKRSHHLRNKEISRKNWGWGGGSVRFHILIQKWSKMVQNGPHGPKMSQIT